MTARWRRFWLAGALTLLLPSLTQAQPANLQLWGNVTLNWVKSESRDTIDEGFSTADNSINIRLKRLF